MPRVKILEAVDKSWGKFGSDKFPSALDNLFCEEFQSSLTKGVEQDTALSTVISLMKRHQRGKDTPTSSSCQDQPKVDRFSRGPSCQVRRQTGQKLLHVPTHKQQVHVIRHPVQPQQGPISPETQAPIPRTQTAPGESTESPTKAAIDLLES